MFENCTNARTFGGDFYSHVVVFVVCSFLQVYSQPAANIPTKKFNLHAIYPGSSMDHFTVTDLLVVQLLNMLDLSVSMHTSELLCTSILQLL